MCFLPSIFTSQVSCLPRPADLLISTSSYCVTVKINVTGNCANMRAL
jgi:hypothetical protein